MTMIRSFRVYWVAMLLAVFAINAQGNNSDLATAPLVTSSTSSVLPNLMFVLDDSGSMGWNYMPDWANDTDPVSGSSYVNLSYLHSNSGFNGLAYNPAVTYSPPTKYNSDGTLNTTTYPSQTSANTSTWSAVKNDGYGIQSTSTSNLVGNAYYYTFIPGEYCTEPHLRSCTTQAAATTANPYPATLRWCNSSALSTCQAVWISGSYTNPRYPKQATATITVSGTSSTTVSGITVNNVQIMSQATSASTSSSTVANDIAAKINACFVAATGSCGASGYSASVSGSVVTINAPATAGNITYLPVVTKTGMTVTPAAFSGYVSPGVNVRVDIVSTNNSYPYPGTASKASTRSDCAGTTCTYAEEMTNYANWWAYYHTRMQMMKTATSNAFASVGTSYRVGYFSINNNTGSDFLNLGQFGTTQKNSWYAKLFAANPSNSTPLREALSKAGRLYAGKMNGTTFNGSAVTDPMQYSCQQNFTILSTDGYWNGNSGFKLDGTSAIGNQDGVEPRPYFDGANTTVTTVTPISTVVQKQTVTPVSTNTLYTRTVTSVSATMNCSVGGGSCITDSTSNHRTWCMYGNNNVNNTGRCNTFGSGTPKAYACRVASDSSAGATGGAGCISDGAGQTWCVSSTDTGNSCTQLQSSGSAVSGAYACHASASSGYTVTTQPQTYTRTVTGGSTTSIDNYTTTYNQTVVTTNGVAAPATNGSSTTTVTNVSSSSIAPSVDSGAPDGSTTWTNGTSSSYCSASPPTAGTSTAAAGSPSNVNGTPVVTVLSTTGPTAGSATNTTTSTGGTSDTLADVAEYYYGGASGASDLRTSALSNCTGAVVPPATVGNDVCENNVPTSGQDGASWQHMTTFTLGLGASGYMQFLPSYLTATSGDYYDVKNGTTPNPSGGVCSWQNTGSCNWPTPASDSQKNIDDLWHAAVNGRGTYFSATSPATLSAGLSSALAGVSARIGASAAATTSNPNVTSGDNFVFSSTFTTQEWDGELVRQQLDLTTGVTSSTTDWTAQSALDANTSRTIYTYDSATANKLKAFTWANLTVAQQAYFTTPNISTLSQFCAAGVTCLSAASQTAASGENLLNFLRGERTNEGISTDTTKYYRQRTHLLGDIVNAEAVYVKASLYNYADAGYSTFITTNSTRQGAVYAAANDGMLHAFNSSTGAELWAYVPSMVLPNLYKLADKNYSNLHQYFVDGTPVVGDVCVSSCSTASAVWKTILVGGLNGGGRGYYALDVTNPASPKALWEFTHNNLGYTYGNPKITKLSDGTWVVLVASGYNNVSPGDGQGRLFVLNADTGALVTSVNPSGDIPGTITTGVGSDTTTISGVCATAPCPSGLAHIAARVVNPSTDNTVEEVYGGDMYGNLWRFDVNGNVGASGYDAQLLATLRGPSPSSNVQPITTKPEVGTVSGNKVVYVGTGRYLGTTDLSDTSKQTLYAIKDALSASSTPSVAIFSNPRSLSSFVAQTLTSTTCPAGAPSSLCTTGQVVRTSSDNTVNFASDNGWYIDLPDSGERANTDPVLALGTLGFTTNVPNTDACTVGGYSYRYFLDYRTGGAISTAAVTINGTTYRIVSSRLGNALATRPVYVRLPNNTVVELTRLSDGTTLTSNVPIGAGSTSTRRVSWRELIAE